MAVVNVAKPDHLARKTAAITLPRLILIIMAKWSAAKKPLCIGHQTTRILAPLPDHGREASQLPDRNRWAISPDQELSPSLARGAAEARPTA